MKFSVNLHETLTKYNEASATNPQEELALKEAEQILKNSAKKDIDVLSKIGLSTNLSIANEIQNRNNLYQRFDEVYDISAIRKLAINYRLRFLPANLYVGTIDPLLPTMINKFIDKNGVILSKDRSENNDKFYILAPAKSFNLQEKPKDPLMFYKIDDNKFAFIHKWGNDLSLWRLVSNFLLRSVGHFILLLVVVATLMSVFLINTKVDVADFGLICVPIFFMLLVITGRMVESNMFSDDNWNSKDI